MDSTRLPAPSIGTEKQGDGRQINRPGYYKHDGANKVLKTSDLVPGHVQADAFVQIGYRRMTDTEVAEYEKSLQPVKEAKTKESDDKSK